MTNKEFRLDENIQTFCEGKVYEYSTIKVEYIKQAIKLLHKCCKRNEGFATELEIDKIFGDKLTK